MPGRLDSVCEGVVGYLAGLKCVSERREGIWEKGRICGREDGVTGMPKAHHCVLPLDYRVQLPEFPQVVGCCICLVQVCVCFFEGLLSIVLLKECCSVHSALQ